MSAPTQVTEAMIEAGERAVGVRSGGVLWPDLLGKIYLAMKALDPDFERLREALAEIADGGQSARSIARAALRNRPQGETK